MLTITPENNNCFISGFAEKPLANLLSGLYTYLDKGSPTSTD